MKTKKPASKYRAPALEKGLDILELLSEAESPMGMPMIAAELNRSKGEIFRMAAVLEDKPASDFRLPGGMTQIEIDRKTGMRSSGGDIILEAFKPGTGPADSYFVIGAEQVAVQTQSVERQRRISPNAQRAVQQGAGGLF